jgi:isoleucyl-tRNA synthetase
VRKDINCKYTDRIEVAVVTDDPAVASASKQFADYIRGETLAEQLGDRPLAGVSPVDVKITSGSTQLYVKVNQS